MDHTRRITRYTEGRDAGGTTLAFVAFLLAHDGCGVGPSEFRMDENSLACWCPRCDEVRVFGPAERGGTGAVSRTSVVIPALNEERYLGGLLSDLAAQTSRPDEVFVADAGSTDGTVAVARSYPFVEVVESTPPVALGRNAGGMHTGGDVVVFLDADVRLSRDFLERFLGQFGRRGLDVACPLYHPHGSTRAVERFHDLFNAVTRAFQGVLPSGGGSCIAVRGEVFRGGAGFDPAFKFDDIELIRRLSKGRRFGIVGEKVLVSDRRFRESGSARTVAQYGLMALIFALGKYEWADRIDYRIGDHAWPDDRRRAS